jgi:hypothetical protein
MNSNRLSSFWRLLATCLPALLLAGCGLFEPDQRTEFSAEQIENIEESRPRDALEIGHFLLRHERREEALRSYRHARSAAPEQSDIQREALLGIALITITDEELRDFDKAEQALAELHPLLQAKNPSHQENLLLLSLQHLLDNAREEVVLREALSDLEQHRADLAREKQQLEEALTRLRRLTLEQP